MTKIMSNISKATPTGEQEPCMDRILNRSLCSATLPARNDTQARVFFWHRAHQTGPTQCPCQTLDGEKH